MVSAYFTVAASAALLVSTEAHGHHGLTHIVTLHFLPWLSDRPWIAATFVTCYVVCIWAAYRRLSTKEEEEWEAGPGSDSERSATKKTG